MTEPVTLVEQHIILRSDPRFAAIDAAAFAAKNVYNKALYLVRQAFFAKPKGRYLPLGEVYKLVKGTPQYRALPAKVSNDILRQLHKNWKAFFGALKAWQRDPSQFLGRPRPPHYKDKAKGRFLLSYDVQAFGRKALRERGVIVPSGLDIEIETAQKQVANVRIVPRKGFYVIEVVYRVQPEPNPALDRQWVAGIDLGLNNLAALTSNQPGFKPLLVNGRVLKAINQGYNKYRAEYQGKLLKDQRDSRRLQALTAKRGRRIKDYLHTASKLIVTNLVAHRIGTLVIGLNRDWKQRANMGRVSNQAFVAVPFAQFVEMLTYKARLAGIEVIETEESYTSKCSFLDGEALCHHRKYAGKRVHRGLFRASDGRLINADVNASLNIIRKVRAPCHGDRYHPLRGLELERKF